MEFFFCSCYIGYFYGRVFFFLVFFLEILDDFLLDFDNSFEDNLGLYLRFADFLKLSLFLDFQN